MKVQKRLAAFFLAIAMLCAMRMTVYAHEVPDTSRKGTVSATMLYNNQPVSGGSLTLYRVGAVQEGDGNYSFGLTGDFAGSGVSLADLSSDTLAKKLAQYAENQKLSGRTETISTDGTVSFGDLELGLYLVVQTEAAKGYHKADPFLVSVPMNENGTYLYEVDASPKVELAKAPKVTPTPEVTKDQKLPQTGQLNWPVPVMVVLGLLLFGAGWLLRFGKERGGYEA